MTTNNSINIVSIWWIFLSIYFFKSIKWTFYCSLDGIVLIDLDGPLVRRTARQYYNLREKIFCCVIIKKSLLLPNEITRKTRNKINLFYGMIFGFVGLCHIDLGCVLSGRKFSFFFFFKWQRPPKVFVNIGLTKKWKKNVNSNSTEFFLQSPIRKLKNCSVVFVCDSFSKFIWFFQCNECFHLHILK